MKICCFPVGIIPRIEGPTIYVEFIAEDQLKLILWIMIRRFGVYVLRCIAIN